VSRAFNPMDRQPVDCRCGAPAARADEAENPTNPRCHICRKVASEHPAWSPAEVIAAGIRRWLELALAGVRHLARCRAGESVADVVFAGRLEWTVKEGYERLSIRDMDPGAVIDALAAVHPELVITDRATAGEVLALRLQVREEAQHAA